MNRDERLRVLAANAELGASGKRVPADVAMAFDEVFVRRGECIGVEGRLCHQYVVVAEGRLSARRGECTRELVVGDAVGWNAMRARGVNEATVVAATDARLLVMSHAQFARITAAAPPKPHFLSWALPTSRRSLPHRQHLERA